MDALAVVVEVLEVGEQSGRIVRGGVVKGVEQLPHIDRAEVQRRSLDERLFIEWKRPVLPGEDQDRSTSEEALPFLGLCDDEVKLASLDLGLEFLDLLGGELLGLDRVAASEGIVYGYVDEGLNEAVLHVYLRQQLSRIRNQVPPGVLKQGIPLRDLGAGAACLESAADYVREAVVNIRRMIIHYRLLLARSLLCHFASSVS